MLLRNDNAEVDIRLLAQRCSDAMGDDFNTPILISVLFDAVKLVNNVADGRLAISPQQKGFSDLDGARLCL